MKFIFPDSGKTVEIDGYSSLTAAQIRGWYEANYPNKPIAPTDPLEELEDGKVNTPKFKKAEEAFKKDSEQFVKDNALWTVRMRQAQWAGMKLYYASCVMNIDKAEVDKVVDRLLEVPPYINLRETIKSGYAELQVPFPEKYMDNYLYLFHVCISSSGDQTLFENALMLGTTPTQEAVDSALFRLRGKV